MTPKKRDTVNIGGLKAIVGTPEECEAASFVVCGAVSFFSDDIHTICSSCGEAIVHRPYVPITPPKICVPCMIGFVKAEKTQS